MVRVIFFFAEACAHQFRAPRHGTVCNGPIVCLNGCVYLSNMPNVQAHTSVYGWKWETFHQTFNFSSPGLPNCNSTSCCSSQTYAPNFEIINSRQGGELNTTFLRYFLTNNTRLTFSDMPEGFALNTVNISLFGAFNLSDTDPRTIVSIVRFSHHYSNLITNLVENVLTLFSWLATQLYKQTIP